MSELDYVREVSRQLFNEGVQAKTENRQLKDRIAQLESDLAAAREEIRMGLRKRESDEMQWPQAEDTIRSQAEEIERLKLLTGNHEDLRRCMVETADQNMRLREALRRLAMHHSNICLVHHCSAGDEAVTLLKVKKNV